MNSFLGNFYRHLTILSGHTGGLYLLPTGGLHHTFYLMIPEIIITIAKKWKIIEIGLGGPKCQILKSVFQQNAVITKVPAPNRLVQAARH